jgi:hypothetical protein
MLLIAGVVLILLGAAALVYQGVTYTTKKKVIDLGPIQATTKETETIPIPPVLGWIAVGGGGISGCRRSPLEERLIAPRRRISVSR